MPKRYSSRHIIKILETHGFKFISQKGSHAKYRSGNRTVIVVTDKKVIPVGTFTSIVRQAGLKREDFESS